ncbi:MAG: hypothetical protein AAF447_10075 [Myxococcota bacterium]
MIDDVVHRRNECNATWSDFREDIGFWEGICFGRMPPSPPEVPADCEMTVADALAPFRLETTLLNCADNPPETVTEADYLAIDEALDARDAFGCFFP